MSDEKKPVLAFPALLNQQIAEIARALPKHLSPERMSRIALTTFRRTPALAKCDPRSVLAAVIQAAQLGLEPDTLGRSYLIPYGTECQFIPGWKGLVDLVNRTGQASVWTGAVFQGDGFAYQLGDSPFIKHIPEGEDDPNRMTHVYAVGRVKGSDWPVIEVWRTQRVWAHRDRYNKVGKKHYSFQNEEMYARKVVLLQVLKYMPVSAELERAMALSSSAETGLTQGLTIDNVTGDTWEPPNSGPTTDVGASTAARTPRRASESAGAEKDPPASSGAAAAASPAASPAPAGSVVVDHATGEIQSDLPLTDDDRDMSPITEAMQKQVRKAMAATGVNEQDLAEKFGYGVQSIPFADIDSVLKWAKGE